MDLPAAEDTYISFALERTVLFHRWYIIINVSEFYLYMYNAFCELSVFGNIFAEH